MKFRFHLLGFPHTATSRDYNACAYTSKIKKFIDMMMPRGHECIHYGNEGSDVPCEHVQILTEAERAGWFGSHDRQKPYTLAWDNGQPYWQAFNTKAAAELLKRVKKGDFILTLAGNCQRPIADCFPNSYYGIPGHAMFVEYGIGYYGTFSCYRVFESQTHREGVYGRANNRQVCFTDEVIPNYFDLRDFEASPDERVRKIQDGGPYYLFMGRPNQDKGWPIAVDACARIGARLVLAGQGDFGELPARVIRWGYASIEERAALMRGAVATFAPTLYREPFGGVAVESQLCSTPCLTTSHGAFTETVEARWRCTTMREFVDAARAAAQLTPEERTAIRLRAESLYSLEAVAPQYERYFSRLYSLWGGGFYEMRDLELIRMDAEGNPQE